MKCEWCRKNEIAFEIVIYELKKEETSTVANLREKRIQYVRDGKYTNLRLCENCLPMTTTKNIERYKLRGREIKQS